MRTTSLALASAAALLSMSCASTPPATHQPTQMPQTAMATSPTPGPAQETTKMSNPLLASWTGPYGGVPPFTQIKPEHFKPALLSSMDDQRAEIAAIASNSAPPTFDNTIAALEDSGRKWNVAQTLYGIWSSSMSTPELQATEREMAPKIAAFVDEIVQNAKLFARIEAVYQSPDKQKLSPEQQRLAWRQYTMFVRSGAKLDVQAKKRLSEINQKLASLYTSFRQNVLADEEGQMAVLSQESDLAGLPDSVKAGAAAAAEGRGEKGKWVISNTRSSVEPFLTYSTSPELREKVWRNYVNRADNGDAHDNNKNIAAILKLRAERAKLLGYPTHAHYRLEDAMAKTPERAMTLMETVWPKAVARAREEVADMLAVAKKEGPKKGIDPWDYRYYAEKVRKAKYDLDANEVKPYLQLEKLREGMFWVAGELLGFQFKQVNDVEVYHPDVRVWQVTDRTSGKHVGLWYFDPYARKGKRSGAWMNDYRSQERFKTETAPIVSNNANFVKGKSGESVLISWDDARTLFHEFGHALHGLSSNVTYPSLSGTSVARDYVEFPSQLLEHWLSTPEVLNRFAVHYQTGKPMPPEILAKIEKAATFNQGFGTVEYLASALIDMKLHLAGERDIDPDAFERDTLATLGMPKEIVMRHRTPHFSHVFGDDGYSAAYYSYLWADTLSADAYEAFVEGKGPYDSAVATKLRQHVLSVGDSVDPADGYRKFRGRDAGVDALMRDRGFVKAKAQAPKAKAAKPKAKS